MRSPLTLLVDMASEVLPCLWMHHLSWLPLLGILDSAWWLPFSTWCGWDVQAIEVRALLAHWSMAGSSAVVIPQDCTSWRNEGHSSHIGDNGPVLANHALFLLPAFGSALEETHLWFASFLLWFPLAASPHTVHPLPCKESSRKSSCCIECISWHAFLASKHALLVWWGPPASHRIPSSWVSFSAFCQLHFLLWHGRSGFCPPAGLVFLSWLPGRSCQSSHLAASASLAFPSMAFPAPALWLLWLHLASSTAPQHECTGQDVGAWRR